MHNLHTGKNKRHNFLLASTTDAPIRIKGEIAAALIANRRRTKREHQQAIHPLRVPQCGQFRQIGTVCLKPHRIGVVDEESFGAHQRQCTLNAASGIE